MGFPILSIFLAICSILELKGAISTVFAAFLSSNLPLTSLPGSDEIWSETTLQLSLSLRYFLRGQQICSKVIPRPKSLCACSIASATGSCFQSNMLRLVLTVVPPGMSKNSLYPQNGKFNRELMVFVGPCSDPQLVSVPGALWGHPPAHSADEKRPRLVSRTLRLVRKLPQGVIGAAVLIQHIVVELMMLLSLGVCPTSYRQCHDRCHSQ